MTSYRIPNSYQTPIGSALGNLMTAFASMPSPEERALKAAQLDQIQSTAALNRQKLVDSQGEAQRAAAYGGNIAGVINKIFSPPPEQPRATPDSIGPMPAVPADEHVRSNLGALAGAVDPKQVGALPELFLSMFANAPGTSQGTVERSQIGAGKPYASTQTAVDNELARKVDVEMNKNQRAENAARYAADRQATTQDRIDARQGKQVIGADGNAYWHAPGMPYHGLRAPFAQQSGPLATDAVKARGQLDALDSFKAELGNFMGEVASDPSAVGAAGTVRTIISGLTEQAKAMGQTFGVDTATGINAVQDALRRQGITVADPGKAAKIAVYINTLPFKAAQALAAQTGRDLSDRDVKRFEGVIGASPITNEADLRARVEVITRMIDDEVARVSPRLNMRPPQPGSLAPIGVGNGVSGLGATIPQTFGQPAAPAAAPQAAPVQKWGRDANGRPVPVR